MKHSAIFVLVIFSLLTVSLSPSGQKGIKAVGTRPPDLPDVVYRTGWALVIGIDDYPHLPPQNQLNYAVKDATDLAELLQAKFGFPEENITVITNAGATKEGIENALASLADTSKVGVNDCVLVFFSGHGQTVTMPRTGGEVGFIVPSDARVDLSGEPNLAQYSRYCIDMQRLKRDASFIPAKHILFLVDACYSGLALGGHKVIGSKMPGYMRKIVDATAQQMITAGGRGDESLELSRYGHGVFTYKLLEGLDKRLADMDEDGIITGLELGTYLTLTVPKINANQVPQTGKEGEGDFIFLPQITPEDDEGDTVRGVYRLDIAAPDGFRVFLDDEDIGQETPTLLALPAGQYKVRLEKPGYENIEKTVTLDAGYTLATLRETAVPVEVDTKEEEGFGMLFVKALAEGQLTAATVFVDDQEVGDSPYTNGTIPAGVHEVKVSKPLYHDYHETVTVAKDRKYTVNGALQPAFGSLEVDSTPSGAEVELLDTRGTRRGSGKTPFQLAKVASGTYRLKVTQRRYYTVDKDIAIRDGRVTAESLPLKPKFGYLEVKSTPAGASVVLAGTGKGKTPLTLEVDSGRYALELRKEVYLDWSGEVDIWDGETTRISRQLPPNFGTLDVQITPAGSEILVDGKRAGDTPAKLKLTPGTHKVEVKGDAYVPEVHESVFISRDQTEVLTGSLERMMGTLRVISTPPEAHITVDGKDHGPTPNIIRLSTGSYKLKLTKEDFRDYEETVTIVWDKTVVRNVELPTGPAPSITGKDGALMMLIPAGEFQMGSNDYKDEKPVHTVYLDDFYMDVYEVTNAQYKKFVDANPQWRRDRIGRKYHDGDYLKDWNGNNYPNNKADHPVVYVSWYATNAYAQWAGKRLPTEAEWEKAARGGLVGKKYPWGDSLTHDDANYPGTGGKDRWDGTSPVGSFAPNGYGLYDMAGNVWEWCADWHEEDYYTDRSARNPTGPRAGTSRVLRGGSWYYYFPNDLRVANRLNLTSTGTYYGIGFRCVSQD